MKDKRIKNTRILEFKSEELKIIHTYRLFSWFLTSIFYFLGNPPSHWIFKMGVIILLFISAKITIEVYNKYDRNFKIERSFIFMETMGIILLLLPTGGANSPFIWYALNPVLISASFLSYYFCWFNLLCYLSASIIISFLFFNLNNDSLTTMVSRYSHLILIFILITLAVQLLTKLTNKLREQSNELLDANIQLNQANNRIHESMNHIMSLYQTVEALTSQDNKEDIYHIFAEYTARLTGTDMAFFWLKTSDGNLDIISISSTIEEDIEDALIARIEEISNDTMSSEGTFKINIGDYRFSIAPVKSTSRIYGLIGFKTHTSEPDIIKEEHTNQLEFISELSAVILERFHLEEVTERLMIAEEQNRIANEMHDSVAQELFSISYAAHSIIENWEDMPSSQLKERLNTLQNSAHSAMKELRSTIYRLSSRKGGEKSFKSSIKDYLNNISKLNNVDINLEITGDEELTSISKKRGLYRIICEATGNALRHGRCSLIKINIVIEKSFVELNIVDNGEGFILDDVCSNQDTGLGLQNMKRLVGLFDGEINISSKLGNGTAINILIPNGKVAERKQGGLAI